MNLFRKEQRGKSEENCAKHSFFGLPRRPARGLLAWNARRGNFFSRLTFHFSHKKLTSVTASTLRGEADFQYEQKPASARKSGEGECNQRTLLHPHPEFQALVPRTEIHPSLSQNLTFSQLLFGRVLNGEGEGYRRSSFFSRLTFHFSHKKSNDGSKPFPISSFLFPKNSTAHCSLNKILHTTHYIPITQKAFTLAEVLIVLGIIGAIAAMTLPPLIVGQQKQTTVERYKKVYSTLANMVTLSTVNNGPVDSWDTSFTTYNHATDIPWLQKYILPYLSISKSCNATGNSGCWADGCIKAPSGNNISMMPNNDGNFMKYVLNDGTSIAFIFRDHLTIEILVDLDGPNKGNNQMGKDIFDFRLTDHSGVYPIGHGVDIKNLNYSSYGCGKDVTDGDFAGSYCGEKIIQDGYKIADDYPW